MKHSPSSAPVMRPPAALYSNSVPSGEYKRRMSPNLLALFARVLASVGRDVKKAKVSLRREAWRWNEGTAQSSRYHHCLKMPVNLLVGCFIIIRYKRGQHHNSSDHIRTLHYPRALMQVLVSLDVLVIRVLPDALRIDGVSRVGNRYARLHKHGVRRTRLYVYTYIHIHTCAYTHMRHGAPSMQMYR